VLEDLGCAQRRTKLLHAALSRDDASGGSSRGGGCPGLRGAMVLARCWLAARHRGGGLGYDAPDGEQLDAVRRWFLDARAIIFFFFVRQAAKRFARTQPESRTSKIKIKQLMKTFTKLNYQIKGSCRKTRQELTVSKFHQSVG
jgi:hypothetical protein